MRLYACKSRKQDFSFSPARRLYGTLEPCRANLPGNRAHVSCTLTSRLGFYHHVCLSISHGSSGPTVNDKWLYLFLSRKHSIIYYYHLISTTYPNISVTAIPSETCTWGFKEVSSFHWPLANGAGITPPGPFSHPDTPGVPLRGGAGPPLGCLSHTIRTM